MRAQTEAIEMRRLRQMFSDGIDVARTYGDNAFHLHGEQLERQFQTAFSRMQGGEFTVQPPPVLTPGDLIALRDEWRTHCERHGYTGQAAEGILEDLSTLLDRLSGTGEGQSTKISISGAGQNESEGQSVQRPTDGNRGESEG